MRLLKRCPQITRRYKEKTKEQDKEQKKKNGKQKPSHSFISRPAKRARSPQPAASAPAPVPTACVTVADLDTLVHVPVVVGPEVDAGEQVTLEGFWVTN